MENPCFHHRPDSGRTKSDSDDRSKGRSAAILVGLPSVVVMIVFWITVELASFGAMSVIKDTLSLGNYREVKNDNP